MHADETIGALGHGGERGHRDRGSVAGDDDVVAEQAIGFGESVALDFELFGDGFDEEVGVGDGGHVGDRDDAGEDVSLFVFGEFAFFNFAIEIFGDGVEGAIEVALLDVAEEDFVAGAGEDVSDAVAHGAGAEDGDGFDGVEGQRGLL